MTELGQSLDEALTVLGRRVKPDWPLTCVLIVGPLRKRAPRHAALWADHEAGVRHTELKRIRHPDVGVLELHSQVLFVFTAIRGTESYEKLRRLSVIGGQRLTT